jgi:hypothetical protein
VHTLIDTAIFSVPCTFHASPDIQQTISPRFFLLIFHHCTILRSCQQIISSLWHKWCTLLGCSIQSELFSTLLLLRKALVYKSSYPFSPHNLQYHVVLSFLHIIPDSLGSKRYMDLLFLARLALSDGYLETHCTYSSLHTFTSYKRKRLQLTASSFSSADPSFHAPSPSRQTHLTTSTGISFSAAASDPICINHHGIITVKHVALADCTATWLRR